MNDNDNPGGASPDPYLFWNELNGTSDRAGAVLVAAQLDVQLERLLEAFLVPDRKAVKEFISSSLYAPLGSFSARIAASYCLGLISPMERNDLDVIRRVRNEFAHGLAGTSFTTPKVASLCEKFQFIDVFNKAAPGSLDPTRGAANRFIFATMFITSAIESRTQQVDEQRRSVASERDFYFPGDREAVGGVQDQG